MGSGRLFYPKAALLALLTDAHLVSADCIFTEAVGWFLSELFITAAVHFTCRVKDWLRLKSNLTVTAIKLSCRLKEY